MLQGFPIFAFADNPAQRPQILDAAEHHHVREKLHRIGERLWRAE